VPVTAKIRRRWFGAMCLLAAIIMLATGDTSPGKRLEGMAFVIYWLGCFAFAALALLTAVLDARALRREARAEQRELLENALDGIGAQKGQSSKLKAQKNLQPPDSDAPSPS